MKNIYLFVFICIIGILTVQEAQADRNHWFKRWWPSLWENDVERPYLLDPKTPHVHAWEDPEWDPEDWISQDVSAEDMIARFYTDGVITGQYEDNDLPVLEVGQGFMDLSNQDRLKVAKFVDYVYQITPRAENGMFYLYHHKTEEPIGIYTARGLQLQ